MKLREHRTDSDFGPLFSGEVLRDEGIAKVTEHNGKWMELCVEVATRFASVHHDFTGEDIRMDCGKWVGLPHHSNAWGALINTLVRRKIIKPTGEYRAMKDDRSHARKTAVYIK